VKCGIIGVVDDAAIDWLTEQALKTLARDESIPPAATTLLLRRWVTTGRNDLSDALGPALARALEESSSDRDSSRRSEWLSLFVEALGISEDDRLHTTVDALVAALRGGWPSRGDVNRAMRSIDACLVAAGIGNTDLVHAAIDELERIVGLAYQPGEGIARTLDQRSGEPGTLADHVAAASALLSAHAVTGRLPYSMLAEELVQFARQSWWDDARGGFHARMPNDERSTSNLERRTKNDIFVANCEAARVLCRLAALHHDQDYRQAAVIAQQSDYEADAARTLESLAEDYRAIGLDAAIYGLALGEIQILR
jgi:hypothetical protein